MAEVPTSVNLKFLVIGFNKGGLAECPNFHHVSPDVLSQMGAPKVVGIKDQTLEPVEENIVSIDISITNSKTLNNCGGLPFDWETGGFFGTARFGQSRFAP